MPPRSLSTLPAANRVDHANKYRVINTSGSPIPANSIVVVSGVDEGKRAVRLATDTDAALASERFVVQTAMGTAGQDRNGVVMSRLLLSMSTSGASQYDPVYINGAGALVFTDPGTGIAVGMVTDTNEVTLAPQTFSASFLDTTRDTVRATTGVTTTATNYGDYLRISAGAVTLHSPPAGDIGRTISVRNITGGSHTILSSATLLGLTTNANNETIRATVVAAGVWDLDGGTS